MFIRTNKTPNSPRKSIQICETYRKDGKVKQRIVHYVGVAFDEAEEQKLKNYARDLIAKITVQRDKQSPQSSLLPLTQDDVLTQKRASKGRPRRKKIEDILPPNQVSLEDVVEESRIVEGVHEVAGIVFDELYGSLLKGKRVMEQLKDVVLARLVMPGSKHRAQKQLDKQFGKTHDLDALYRMMDQLFPRISDMKRRTFEKTRALFPDQMDLILFDVTTLYFESINVDDLRNFGYSKDHRFNTTQVVLALATNQDGLPVGYELFEGSTAEVSTLLSAMASWKQLFNIKSVCFIGDRAMFTKKNIALLEAHQCQYIIAAKLKKLPQSLQQQMFSESHYRPGVLKRSLAWIGEFKYEGARLIVSYKSQRAFKDQKDRQRLLQKLEKLLGKKGANPNKLITNSGAKRFVTKDDKANIFLDEEKIERAAQWDGLHGIITNITEEKAEALIVRYARLWVIEESFRINKHTLKMRPIYHWKPERIHAHIAMCYMTFSVLRHLQYRVNLTQKVSIDSILEELLNVQASIHVHKKTKDRYRIPGYLTHQARKIYKAFQLKRSQDATTHFQ